MPFAWTTRNVYNDRLQLDSAAEFSPLYRFDKVKIGEDDLLHSLAEIHKLHATSSKVKFPVVPGAFRARVSMVPTACLAVTPSLLPITPYSPSSVVVPAREILEFDPPFVRGPNLSYYNFLYVYPTAIDFSGISSSSNRARNIACRVELLETDETPLTQSPVGGRCVFGKAFTSRYNSHALTTVSYHNPTTGFLDEIKITLPVQATSRHHLLFTFYHITVDSQKKEKTESVVGYSWLPIIQESGRCEGSFELPVASASTSGDHILPANYTQATRSRADMDKSSIKWLDGGKALFSVKTACKSSVYTNDDHLRKFFRATESDDLSDLSSNALRERIKALHAVLPDELFRYHPVIFNQLFEMLTRKTSVPTDTFEDVPDHILKFLIYAVDFICTTMKDDPNGANRLMNSYLTHVFKTPVTSPNQPSVHEQLIKYMVESSNHTDITVKEKLLKNIWWFLGIVSKSMAQHVAAFKLFGVKRDERFTPVRNR